MLPAEFATFRVLAVEHELANAGKALKSCRGDVLITGCTGPDSGFSQIDALGGCAPVNHRPDAPVAQRHGLHPAGCRACVPEFCIPFRFARERVQGRPRANCKGDRAEHKIASCRRHFQILLRVVWHQERYGFQGSSSKVAPDDCNSMLKSVQAGLSIVRDATSSTFTHGRSARGESSRSWSMVTVH